MHSTLQNFGLQQQERQADDIPNAPLESSLGQSAADAPMDVVVPKIHEPAADSDLQQRRHHDSRSPSVQMLNTPENSVTIENIEVQYLLKSEDNGDDTIDDFVMDDGGSESSLEYVDPSELSQPFGE